jgi:hypothetical protein
MTNGTHAIRVAIVVLALTACGSAAAQIPSTNSAPQQRSSDAYLTAGEGASEGSQATSGAGLVSIDGGRTCTPDFRVCIEAQVSSADGGSGATVEASPGAALIP